MSTETNQMTGAKVERKAATPAAGAIAGMLFAVLFSVSMVLVMTTMAQIESGTGASLESSLSSFELALGLIPFAGLFFLWFVAVARQRLGRFEDQFFATIFMGSGYIFLGLTFVAAALAGASLASDQQDPAFASSSTYEFARLAVGQLLTIFIPKMLGVFTLSQSVLWLTTRVMPRWMALIALLVAFTLLLGIGKQTLWIVLLFPAWVILVSAYILVNHFRTPASAQPVAA
jgi:hypothetical protein